MYDNLRRWLDIDDLLFSNRNRDYGAYQLRKKYNSAVCMGIIVSVLLFLLAVIIPFLFRPKNDNVLVGNRGFLQLDSEHLETPQEQIFVPPPPPAPDAIHVEEIAKYVPPTVVDSVPVSEKKQLSTDEYKNQTTEDITDTKGTGDGEGIMGEQDGTLTDGPFLMVEIMPSFRGGGLDKFREWVQRRTNYPQAAFEKKLKGKVVLTFIVEKDGSVSNVTVVQSVDPLLDEAAVKTIQSSPKWTPGMQRGEPVRVRYSIPLNFTM